MSREYLPCPSQMRNGGSPPTHLSSPTATALGEPRWLHPPKRAPEPGAPARASYVATFALACYNEVVSHMMISVHDAALAACADIAAHAQRVETARSAALAAWHRQEDAVHTQALAEEADMRRRHDDNYAPSPPDSRSTSISLR